MANWYANGGVMGLDPSGNGLTGDRWPLLYTVPAVQDANGITRGQYTPVLSSGTYSDRLSIIIRTRIFTNDWIYAATVGPGTAANWRIFGVMYVVPAGVFGGRMPTNEQVRQAAHDRKGWAYRSAYHSGDTGPGSGGVEFPFLIHGPRWQGDLVANTKYWVMGFIEAFNPNDGSPRSGVPIPNWTGNNNSVTALGRTTSIWTNRTPNRPTFQILQAGNPVSYITVPAGASNLTLSMSDTGDPDNLSSSTPTNASMDRAGAQVQYSRRGTPGVPAGPWMDLPYKYSSSVTHANAYIAYSSISNNIGVASLAQANPIPLSVGAGAAAPNSTFVLPPGNWRLRARTFDYGHAYPDDAPPVGRTPAQAASLTPNNYPSVNTSPWSEVSYINVMSQVLPPVPLSPIGNVGIPQDPDSTFLRFDWQYRNTATPPFDQAEWEMRHRKVGATAWVTTSGLGSGTIGYVPRADLAVGSQYEWAVRTKDTTGVWSEWSNEATARFWMVAAPGSGDYGVMPNDILEGASLGIGTHRAFIYRRGGTVRVGEITDLSHVSWDRVRDDMSHAKIVTNKWDLDKGTLLSKLQTWAYELVLYRDNGFSLDRVWEGPITLLTYETDSVTIQARDISAYSYRRILKQAMHDHHDGASVVDRAMRVLQNALAPDDPNVLAYVTPISGTEDDAIQYRSTPEYGRTAFEEIDDMASNAGLDYTVVGRSTLLWSTRNRIGLLPEFRDVDLGSAPIVSEYGMSMANYLAVTDGNGLWGSASRLVGADDNGQGGNDPDYGIVEMLSSSWASDSEEEGTTYTEEAKEKIRESFREFAERSIADRYPPPVIVRVPANTTLNPNALVSIKNLIPGVAIPLRSSSTLRPVRAMQKLDSVKVVEEAGKETISITMSPFARQDDELVEEE